MSILPIKILSYNIIIHNDNYANHVTTSSNYIIILSSYNILCHDHHLLNMYKAFIYDSKIKNINY